MIASIPDLIFAITGPLMRDFRRSISPARRDQGMRINAYDLQSKFVFIGGFDTPVLTGGQHAARVTALDIPQRREAIRRVIKP